MPLALGPTLTGLAKPDGLKMDPSRSALTVYEPAGKPGSV